MWVIVDRLTKSAHFFGSADNLHSRGILQLYIREIVRLHGVPISIISDQDPKFMDHFWKGFQQVMGTQLMMSTTFHPQTDGQLEMTIQTLENMLQACVFDLKGSWEEHLPLVEFVYNNSYQVSI